LIIFERFEAEDAIELRALLQAWELAGVRSATAADPQ
jgi:hypothetical protein